LGFIKYNRPKINQVLPVPQKKLIKPYLFLDNKNLDIPSF